MVAGLSEVPVVVVVVVVAVEPAVLVADPGGDVERAVDVKAAEPPAPGLAVTLKLVAVTGTPGASMTEINEHPANLDVVSNVVGVVSQAVRILHDLVLVITLIVVVSKLDTGVTTVSQVQSEYVVLDIQVAVVDWEDVEDLSEDVDESDLDCDECSSSLSFSSM